MRTSLINLLLVLMVGLLLAACERKVTAPTEATKRYALKGKVVKVEKANKRVEVAHEKIEGFMDAMTMPFAVKDEASLEPLKEGDYITATLIYNTADNRSWLEEVKVVP
ncbi:MAG TPA: copper-binding protein [Blastocatellia bacterium]|nr:copper-binding protein [Blastocatellia bacterium]